MTSRKVLAHSLTFLASLRLVLSCHASGIIIMMDSGSDLLLAFVRSSRTESKFPLSLMLSLVAGRSCDGDEVLARSEATKRCEYCAFSARATSEASCRGGVDS